ncbi:MAG: rod shape-determining protein MreD [Planctomycetota bacterium]
MNRLVFIVAAYLALLAQATLQPLWTFGGGTTGQGIAPSVFLVLAVFVGQCGPGVAALGSALILGILADTFARPYPELGVLIGPYTLGFTVGVYAVLQLRTLLFRHAVLTLAVMTLVAGVFVELVAAVMLGFRGLSFLADHPLAEPGVAASFGRGLLRTLYTVALSVPLGWLLLRTRHLWHFGHG